MGGRFEGTGDVDFVGWLSRGWDTIREDVVTFAVATLLAGLVSLVTCGILGPAMQCGLAMMVLRKKLHGHVEIGHVFNGTRRFVPAILAALLLLVPGLLIYMIAQGPQLVVQFAAPKNAGALLATGLWSMVSSFILSALFAGAIFFVFPHIAARNVGPIEALQGSWEVFRRNILMFAVTAFVYNLIAEAGALACCIGAFVTAPLIVAATVNAYIDHFGLQGVNIDD